MADPTSDPGIEVRTYFVRGRNALVARAEFSELYAALYLHEMDIGRKVSPDLDQLLRDGLAAITLHCASRPRNESVAWTVNFQSPRANVFVSGDSAQGRVVGNVFDEGVKEASHGLFYADVIAGSEQPRRSVIEFDGTGDFLHAAETFYHQSEQRPARIFRYDEEDLVLIAAQPDCDLEWLAGLTNDAVKLLDQNEVLSLLETRNYRFECGCSQASILSMLAPVMRRQPEELFGGEETIRVSCPRCGTRHMITRESLEACVAAEKTP